MTEVVLSGSLTESAQFIKSQGLSRAARHYGSGQSLLGANPREVHILPSFWSRRDVHSFRRHIRTIQRRSKACRFSHYDDDGNLLHVDAAWLPDEDNAVRERVPSIREQFSAPDDSEGAVTGQVAIGELEGIFGDGPGEDESGAPDSAEPERVTNLRAEPDDDFLAFLEDE